MPDPRAAGGPLVKPIPLSVLTDHRIGEYYRVDLLDRNGGERGVLGRHRDQRER